MKTTTRFFIALLLAAPCAAEDHKAIGSLESHDPRFDRMIPPDTRIEVIAEGFSWAEGPLWLPAEGCLVFSDVPENRIWKWQEGKGATEYLLKSGTGAEKGRKAGQSGSNGLLLSPDKKLVLCQHGLRQMGMMEAPLGDPKAEYKTLTDRNHEGKKYNSPNDACYHKDGSLFFTDPPYGLPKGTDDPTRETDYSGVYRLSKDGKVTLIDDQLERPNGIGLSPDQKTLYVANSHGPRAIWMAYDLNDDGTVKAKRVFHDVTQFVGTRKGMPDGLKVNDEGYIFATAPGGVWVFDPEGKHLGTIVTEQFSSNVAFGPEQKTLYITADMLLLRVKLK